jgi:hypothetical protein
MIGHSFSSLSETSVKKPCEKTPLLGRLGMVATFGDDPDFFGQGRYFL